MTKVSILIEGYLSNESSGRTCPTISLVQDGDINIIVDPGTAKSQQTIIDALAKHSLKPEDIDIIFLTHSHYDHFRNIALFPAAKVRDYWGLWDNDKFEEVDEKLAPNTRIINTPGHSYDGLTLLIMNADATSTSIPPTRWNGGSLRVAICGDVWFKENKPTVDPYAQNSQALLKSRQKITRLADLVIPGHGKMFKIKK